MHERRAHNTTKIAQSPKGLLERRVRPPLQGIFLKAQKKNREREGGAVGETERERANTRGGAAASSAAP